MSNASIPHAARAASNRERIVEAVEEELARLREKRPGLVSRIDRASHLLVVHLSDPRLGTIRVRIDAKRRPSFLIRSLTSGGVYVVEPGEAGWSCSCPDYHRRNAACKHLVAAWCLRAADRRAWRRRGCSACDHGWVFIGEEILDPGTGELVEAINPVRCRRCNGGLSHDLVQGWLESQRWIFARSRASNPHWYCLRSEVGDQKIFEQVVEFIREYGSPYPWWGAVYDQLPLGNYCYWTMGASIAKTDLINRKSLEQVRIDQLVNKGGAGIVWPWLHNDVEAERAELRKQESAQDELG